LSAIKGLAETLHKPIATVSVLEALASLADGTGKIAAALDAGRKEVFLGVYEGADGKNNSASRMVHEELLSQSELQAAIAEQKPILIVTSDTVIAELAAPSQITVKQVSRPGGDIIARLGARKLLAGETVSVEALDANYLRRSDAEIFFKGTSSK
jgi:tRNA threonylcarbamoyladenosine biosynthesis protein TsaB